MAHTLYNTFSDIIVPDDTKHTLVDIFSDTSGKKSLTLGTHSETNYLIIIHGNSAIDIHIQTAGPHARGTIRAILLGSPDKQISASIKSTLQYDHTASDMHLVSFLQTGSACTLDGDIQIGSGIVGVSGHLLEENIILGEHVQIKTLPKLDVRSNDVSASHGARIERLDAKKLFYAQSRGLDEHAAKGLIIGGYFDLLFAPISAQIHDTAERGQLESLKHNYLKMLMR